MVREKQALRFPMLQLWNWNQRISKVVNIPVAWFSRILLVLNIINAVLANDLFLQICVMWTETCETWKHFAVVHLLTPCWTLKYRLCPVITDEMGISLTVNWNAGFFTYTWKRVRHFFLLFSFKKLTNVKRMHVRQFRNIQYLKNNKLWMLFQCPTFPECHLRLCFLLEAFAFCSFLEDI